MVYIAKPPSNYVDICCLLLETYNHQPWIGQVVLKNMFCSDSIFWHCLPTLLLLLKVNCRAVKIKLFVHKLFAHVTLMLTRLSVLTMVSQPKNTDDINFLLDLKG